MPLGAKAAAAAEPVVIVQSSSFTGRELPARRPVHPHYHRVLLDPDGRGPVHVRRAARRVRPRQRAPEEEALREGLDRLRLLPGDGLLAQQRDHGHRQQVGPDEVPHSGTLTCLQFGFSAGMVLLLKLCRVLDADSLQLTKVKQFAPAVIMFYISIACNMRLLARATVDTFIVIRSVAPILTQVGEVFLLGADWPNRDAWLALLTISMGALGFAHNNLSQMSDPVVLFWASTYLLCITADMLIVKRVITAIKLKPWGYVYYNNLLALCVYPFWALVTGEEIGRTDGSEDTSVMVAVATSCILGLGISFFGLNTRLALSATAFTVFGAACKFLSIFLNMAVWHHHAPHPALPWLLLALGRCAVLPAGDLGCSRWTNQSFMSCGPARRFASVHRGAPPGRRAVG